MRLAGEAWVTAMAKDDRTAAALEQASERFLGWLREELPRRARTPRSRLLALWDALEDWFASDDFHASPLPAALAAPADDAGRTVPAALAAHRVALRRLLAGLASSAGADDPAGLAAQLELLVRGATVGVLVDREPRIAQHARELTELALGADASRGREPSAG
jgi:AcrR family transcriptional regulator